MKDTEKVLKDILSDHFAGQSQRLTMLSKLVISIIKMSSISYAQLSLVLNPFAKRESNFKRIQRFMKEYKFCRKCYIQLVWKLIVFSNQWVALNIDRTN